METDIAARLEELEKTAKDHESRLVALEDRLDPKTRERMSAAALEDLLDELAGGKTHT